MKVLVASNEVTLPEGDGRLPIYAPDITLYPEVTTNAQGGARGDGTGYTGGNL